MQFDLSDNCLLWGEIILEVEITLEISYCLDLEVLPYVFLGENFLLNYSLILLD